MPRYFFHLSDLVIDTVGQELPNDEAAIAEAILTARELARNLGRTPNERVVVTKADGSLLYEARLDDGNTSK